MNISRASILITVLAVVLLTSDFVEGGRRRWLRIRGRKIWRRYLKGPVSKWAVTKLATFGKREADCPALLTTEEAQQAVENLKKTCSDLTDDPLKVGLTREEAEAAFNNMDEDKDGSLKEEELIEFVKYIDDYEDCAELAKMSTETAQT